MKLAIAWTWLSGTWKDHTGWAVGRWNMESAHALCQVLNKDNPGLFFCVREIHDH